MSIQSAKIIGENISAEVYRRQEHPVGHPQHVMSRGSLMEFANCPHRWRAGYQSDDTKATEWGSLMDCLVLSQDRFATDFAVAPETYTDAKTGEEKPWNWNAKVCQAWRDEHDGATIIKSDLKARAYKAIEVLESDSEIWPMLVRSRKQVMVMATWKDKATGLEIPLKALLDFVPGPGPFGKSLGDFKTGASAEPRKHSRSVFDHNYDAQAALYLDMWTAATDEDRIDFLHVVQESYEPYEVATFILTEEYITLGRKKYTDALEHYAQCLKTGFWPGYSTRDTYKGCSFIKPEPWMELSVGERFIGFPVEQQQEEPDREPSEVMP